MLKRLLSFGTVLHKLPFFDARPAVGGLTVDEAVVALRGALAGFFDHDEKRAAAGMDGTPSSSSRSTARGSLGKCGRTVLIASSTSPRSSSATAAFKSLSTECCEAGRRAPHEAPWQAGAGEAGNRMKTAGRVCRAGFVPRMGRPALASSKWFPAGERSAFRAGRKPQ